MRTARHLSRMYGTGPTRDYDVQETALGVILAGDSRSERGRGCSGEIGPNSGEVGRRPLGGALGRRVDGRWGIRCDLVNWLQDIVSPVLVNMWYVWCVRVGREVPIALSESSSRRGSPWEAGHLDGKLSQHRHGKWVAECLVSSSQVAAELTLLVGSHGQLSDCEPDRRCC